jgi:cytochrome c
MLESALSLRAATRAITAVCLCALTLSALVACGGESSAPGDPVNGQKLFSGEIPIQSPRGDLLTCVECHAIAEGQQVQGLGPPLIGIGSRASSTVQGQSAEDYLRTSIADPDAYLSNGFQDGLMYREYSKVLTPQQINDLVAYMLTVK